MARTLSEQTRSLAVYLPGGRMFKQARVAGSNFYGLLTGLGRELVTAAGYIATYQAETKPDKTVLFLDEWERAVGIPDDCFFGTGTADERRTHVLVKLASLGVQTAQDFIDLAELFGSTVTVQSAASSALFPFTFPLVFIPIDEARFTIVVTFTASSPAAYPLTFPITFGDPIVGILECLYSKLKPANCDLLFIQV